MVAANELSRRAMATEDGLTNKTEFSAETMQVSAIAFARAEMEGAILVAKKFPRNEDDARQKLMRSCARPRFAEEVTYAYKRGQQQVTGLSVYFAREAARLWGNIRYGYYVVRDDDDERHIRCWAWDVETNAKVEFDDTFRKLVQRKDRSGGATVWVRPDERDLRELTGNRAARVVRNAILALLPEDLKSECEERAIRTTQNAAAEDPDAARKRVVDSFGLLNIPASEIDRYLGHKLAMATPAELADLRRIWKALNEGSATWAEFAPPDAGVGSENGTARGSGSGPVTPEALKNGKATSGARRGAQHSDDAMAGLSQGIKEATTPAAVRAVLDRAEIALHRDKVISEAQFSALESAAADRLDDLQPASSAPPPATASTASATDGYTPPDFDGLVKMAKKLSSAAAIEQFVESVAFHVEAGGLSGEQANKLASLVECQKAIVAGEKGGKK